jgi:4-amino-4-deoxy-L-arabinose transferase-like glycosyltransferase
MFTDERLRFLALWTLYALIFFSTARNKLPGYVLPLFPPLALISAIGLASARRTRVPLALAALFIGVIPIAAGVLPEALSIGLTRSTLPRPDWPWLLAALAAAGVCLYFQHRDRRADAFLLVAALLGITLLSVKLRILPVLDRTVSARPFFVRHGAALKDACLAGLDRDLTYGLQYYAGRALPVCTADHQTPRIVALAGRLVLVD